MIREYFSFLWLPRQHLLHYLKSLQSWFPREEWAEVPIATTAWSLLKDSYHSRMCLSHSPEHIAVAVIYLALLSYGLEVPYNKYADTPWWKVCFCVCVRVYVCVCVEFVLSRMRLC